MTEKFESMNELDKAVAESDLIVTTLQELREMLEYKKLGSRVLSEIAMKLQGQGLGYFPREALDNNDAPRQWEEVRIYAKNSSIGKLVDAVLEPSQKNDTFLIEASSAEDAQAAEILDQIRTLIDG